LAATPAAINVLSCTKLYKEARTVYTKSISIYKTCISSEMPTAQDDMQTLIKLAIELQKKAIEKTEEILSRGPTNIITALPNIVQVSCFK